MAENQMPDKATTPQVPVAPPGLSRAMRLVLILSLTVNLLVFGMVLGATLGRDNDRDGRRNTALADVGFSPFTAALSSEDRKALGQALVERGGSLRENRKLLRQQFRDLLDLVSADPFDPQAVRQAMTAQQASLAVRQQIGMDLFIDRLTAMSASERKAVAQRLEHGFNAPPRKRRPDQGQDRGPGHNPDRDPARDAERNSQPGRD